MRLLGPILALAAALHVFGPGLATAQVAETGHLAPAGPAGGWGFGSSVSISGARAAVGAQQAAIAGPTTGAAWIYELDAAGAWSEVAILAPPALTESALFGAAVGLHGDVAVVGAPFHQPAPQQFDGAAFVFERDPTGAWHEVAALTASDGAAFARFGAAVAVFGARALVGAPSKSNGPLAPAGAVYVFDKGGDGLWKETQKLTVADPSPLAGVGNSIGLWGSYAVLGAPAADGAAVGSGAAFLFAPGPLGQLVQLTKLYPLDGASGDLFGQAVGATYDRALIGAPGDDDSGSDAGSAYLFQLGIGGPAGELAKLLPPAPGDHQRFGQAAAIDFGRAALSASAGTPLAPSKAYAYDVAAVGSPGGVPELLAGFAPAATGGTGLFGSSIAISADRVVAGAPYEPDAGAVIAGAAHAFDVEPLSSPTAAVSLGSGGAQALEIVAGPSQAGRPYLLLGGASGTSPGVDAGNGTIVPLNVDAYTLLALAAPNQPPLAGSFGTLGANGQAAASFALPAGADPALAGVTVHHAFVVIELTPTDLSVSFASNALPVLLVP